MESGKKAFFAAGCFWGVEETFRTTPGVLDTAVGYQGGAQNNPTYEEVCTGRTGHAEVVAVTYDPTQVTYEKLLDIFWDVHDPTTLNRQGPDIGTQYRSAIFTADTTEQRQAEQSKQALDQSGRFAQPAVTQIMDGGTFWPAEEYHQKYVAKRRGLL